MFTHYQILGISEDAGADEIKSAFKKQALKYHPDKNHGDQTMEELFKELNTAYQILSNPYSKHKYDMSLKFGSFDIPEQPTAPPHPRYYRRPRRPILRKPKLTSKENLTATLYAFLFALVVGVIVEIGIWTVDYYKAAEREKLLTERRAVFGEAKSAFDKGDLKESLSIIDQMGMFFESEVDMRDYKDMLLSNILIRADQNMEEKRYKAALQLYSILDPFPSGNSLSILLNKAQANKKLGNYDQAIEIYQQLYMDGYTTISFYAEMADLYEDGLKDFDSALEYYIRATNMAAAGYESVFGKAYMVMVNAKLIPHYHYDLFMKRANAYYLTEDYEGSLESLKWTKEMWPDSAINYILSGKCHLAMNENNLACKDFKKAKQLDLEFIVPIECN